MHPCQNNLEKSYTEKKLSTHFLVIYCLQIVHLMQQKMGLIGKDCMKRFCKDLRNME